MKAFVLAGGAGTRLSPLTSYVPKGMIPIAGKPFIDYVITYLAGHGIRNIIMLLSDEDSEVYRNHLDDGSKYGVCLCEPAVLKYCSSGSDIAANVIPTLVAKGERVYGYLTPEPHHDIGSFKQLDEVKKILKTQAKTQSKNSSKQD